MCPNHGQERWLIMQTFYKGLSSQTRAYVDSAAGGGIMNKTLDQAFDLIESMASHDFSWTNERVVQPQGPGMYQVSTTDAVAAQVEVLNRQMAAVLANQNVQTQRNNSGNGQNCHMICQICGIQGHSPTECGIFSQQDNHVSEVNYAQNNGPFSQSYNPNWRNHPNLSYKQGGQYGQQQNYQSNYRPQNHNQPYQ